MARVKVSTVLDEHLLCRAKLEAMKRRRSLSDLLGEALDRYLSEPETHSHSIADRSWGALRVDRQIVDEITAEEDGLFD